MDEKYKPYPLAGKYYKLSGWFLMWAPLKVPYNQIYEKAKMAGYALDESAGMVEKAAMIGRGWIGVKVGGDAPTTDPNIVEISGEFKAYEHVGAYRKIGAAFQMVMKDNPGVKEVYSVYMNSPQTTPENELKTLVCFRV